MAKMPPSRRGAFLFLGGKKWLGDGVFPLMSPTTPPPEKALSALLMPASFQKMPPLPGFWEGWGRGRGGILQGGLEVEVQCGRDGCLASLEKPQ